MSQKKRPHVLHLVTYWPSGAFRLRTHIAVEKSGLLHREPGLLLLRSEMMCPIRIWHSCIRGVSVDGAQMQWSTASFNFFPEDPVSPTVCSPSLGRHHRPDYVRRCTTCRDTDCHISSTTQSFYLSREHYVEAVIIPDGRDARCVYVERQSRQSRTIERKPYFKLRAAMLSMAALPPLPNRSTLFSLEKHQPEV